MSRKYSRGKLYISFTISLVILIGSISLLRFWNSSQERSRASLEGKAYVEQLSYKLETTSGAEKIDSLVIDSCRKGKKTIKTSDPYKLSCSYKQLDFYGVSNYQDLVPDLLELEEDLYTNGWLANSSITLKTVLSDIDLKNLRKEVGYNLTNESGLIDFGFNTTTIDGLGLLPLYGVPNIFESESQDKIDSIAAKAREDYPYMLVIYWNKEYIRENF